jgi:UDP-N-acetylglucosamine 2-epimerase (non-hydrolysing)
MSLDPVLARLRPDVVVVQGDTATTFAAGMAAFLRKIPVAHVEAGLRTRDPYNPFPEEMCRRLTSALASLHLAPTRRSRENLIREGVAPGSIVVSGNTVIDALFWILRHRAPAASSILLPETDGRLMLVTTHRRENFNKPLRNICRAILKIVSAVPDLIVVLPLHRNPHVDRPVRRILDGRERIALLPPLDYIPFVHLMSRSHLILTDSGGVQEEAPSLGVPVLVARRTTERPEGIEAGVAKLVGTEQGAIEREALALLRSRTRWERMARRTHRYGDGRSAARIVDQLLRRFGPAASGGRRASSRSGARR